MKTTRRQHRAYIAAHLAFLVFAAAFFYIALPALVTYLIGPA